MDCLFCKIIAKDIPTTPVVENEHVLVISDIRPKRKVHLLAVPRVHVESWNDISALSGEAQVALNLAIVEAARKTGIDASGYRVISNVGSHGGQEIPHLHLHILGGEPVGPMVA
ncbi:MAG: HIT domain-containing protein [Candidatus Kerfeldbacteria bacterium]|nr:HIT domain-containing protein [Candidatus Kerfeldbacteria bacterium]